MRVEEQRMADVEMEMKKQMGCMAGFLHLFDWHQNLAGKRICSAKRLTPAVHSASSSGGLEESSPATPLSEKQPAIVEITTHATLESPKQSSSTFEEGLRSSWKFREAPRLSLDSRVSGKGGRIVPNPSPLILSGNRSTEDVEKEPRTPSVVARLMGLDALPDSGQEPFKKAELRRSASESRVSRDLMHCRFVADEQPQPWIFEKSKLGLEVRAIEIVRKPKIENLRFSNAAGKSFFDVYPPEPNRKIGSLYGEIEKRLKMRGIDEQAKDLETLKQLLEALQLKGLLRAEAKKSEGQFDRRRNLISDRHFEKAPIVVMKPSKSPKNQMGRRGYESPPPLSSPSKCGGGLRRTEASPRQAKPPLKRENQNSSNGRVRNSAAESCIRSPRRMSIDIEAQRKARNFEEQKRVSSPKKTGHDPVHSRSLRNRKMAPERTSSADGESVSNMNTHSQIDAELQRSKVKDYKEGMSLLERCDKLLHSIAEITANDQPSPVSVLDSSFYNEEGSPPPIAMKRCLDFKDQSEEGEDPTWSSAFSPIQSKAIEQSQETDFLYVSELVRAFDHLQTPKFAHKFENSDTFAMLETKLYQCNKFSTSKASTLHRRLLFDTVSEIFQREQNANSWKAFSAPNRRPGLRQIWSELQRVQGRLPVEDICEAICGILERDMVGRGPEGWGDRSEEMSEAVLDIERHIFKDLVAETIRELAVFGPKWTASVAPRRKLAF